LGKYPLFARTLAEIKYFSPDKKYPSTPLGTPEVVQGKKLFFRIEMCFLSPSIKSTKSSNSFLLKIIDLKITLDYYSRLDGKSI